MAGKINNSTIPQILQLQWDIILISVMVVYLAECILRSNFTSLCLIADILFFLDNSFKYLRINSEKSNYFQSKRYIVLLTVDIILSVPFGFLFVWWKSLPVFKLLELQQTRKPILNFFRQKAFRKEFIQALREHLNFRKSIRQYYYSLTMSSQPNRLLGPIRRLIRIIGFIPRVNKKFSIVDFYLALSHQLAWIIIVIRCLDCILSRIFIYENSIFHKVYKDDDNHIGDNTGNDDVTEQMDEVDDNENTVTTT